MRAWKPALLCPVLAAATLAALAQTGGPPVAGHVEDAAGNPVAGAAVALMPTSFRGARVDATTGDDGRYVFRSTVPAIYRLRVTHAGLAMQSVEAVAILDGGELAWDLEGPVNPLQIPEITLADGQSIRYDVVLADASAPPLDPAEWRSSLDRCTELVQQGRCLEALPKLEYRASGFPHQAKGHYLLGFCRASLGQTTEGIASLRRAHELNPKMSGVALLIGQILMQSGDTPGAAKWFRAEAENTSDPRLQLEAWIALGYLQRDSGETDAAIEAFEKSIALAPARQDAYGELASLYVEADRPDRVAELLTAARRTGPVDIGPLLNLAIARMNDKQYDQARASLDSAMELAASDEQRAMVHALIGRCQLGRQRRQEGIASLRKSLELDGDGRFAAECRKILQDIGA